jgi:hypothetical protein
LTVAEQQTNEKTTAPDQHGAARAAFIDAQRASSGVGGSVDANPLKMQQFGFEAELELEREGCRFELGQHPAHGWVRI